MSVCPKCQGRKYIELDKIGLVVAECPECKGTGVIDDDSDRIERDNQPTGSGPKTRKRRKRKVKGSA